MCIWFLSTEFGLMVHNVFAGNVTSTFPVNFFFWFMAGGVNACVAWNESRAPEPQTAPANAEIRSVWRQPQGLPPSPAA